jgi:hypothetical protein
MGGESYKGAGMKDVHMGMGVKAKHFDKTVEYLVATLKEMNVPEDIINECAVPILAMKDDIIEPDDEEPLKKEAEPPVIVSQKSLPKDDKSDHPEEKELERKESI